MGGDAAARDRADGGARRRRPPRPRGRGARPRARHSLGPLRRGVRR
jgi:hypothetical protein